MREKRLNRFTQFTFILGKLVQKLFGVAEEIRANSVVVVLRAEFFNVTDLVAPKRASTTEIGMRGDSALELGMSLRFGKSVLDIAPNLIRNPSPEHRPDVHEFVDDMGQWLRMRSQELHNGKWRHLAQTGRTGKCQ